MIFVIFSEDENFHALMTSYYENTPIQIYHHQILKVFR